MYCTSRLYETLISDLFVKEHVLFLTPIIAKGVPGFDYYYLIDFIIIYLFNSMEHGTYTSHRSGGYGLSTITVSGVSAIQHAGTRVQLTVIERKTRHEE
jgi:hypothetical protein